MLTINNYYSKKKKTNYFNFKEENNCCRILFYLLFPLHTYYKWFITKYLDLKTINNCFKE